MIAATLQLPIWIHPFFSTLFCPSSCSQLSRFNRCTPNMFWWILGRVVVGHPDSNLKIERYTWRLLVRLQEKKKIRKWESELERGERRRWQTGSGWLRVTGESSEKKKTNGVRYGSRVEEVVRLTSILLSFTAPSLSFTVLWLAYFYIDNFN